MTRSYFVGISTPTLLKLSLNIVLLAGTLLSGRPTPKEDFASRIDQYLKTRVTSRQFKGKVLVARGDDVLIQGDYGLTGRIRGAQNNYQKFRFPLGAVAEQFVAIAVLQLEEQRKIRTDASICNYVPNCPSAWKDIQVVHLLTHTSGLPSPKPFTNDVLYPTHSQKELLVAIGGQSLDFKPGSRFNYNTLDFTVLCLAIEHASGRSPKEYIESEVFHALKMANTACLSATPTATFLEASNEPQKPLLQNGLNRAGQGSQLCDGHSYSTLEDLYRFERAVEKGTIILHHSLLQMFIPYRDGHGLGWKINKEFDRRVAFQNGSADRTSVSIRLYPDDDVCIIFVADSNDIDSAQLTRDIGAILFGRNYPISTGVGTNSTPIRTQ